MAGGKRRPTGRVGWGLEATSGGHGAPRGAAAPWPGAKLWRANPMGATGTKQARRACGGASRQEGAKPWRRNVPGEASPG